jgi:hypothetical protein
MSSHAVVRTHQEPALVLWGSPGREEGSVLDDLLEWHPQIWTTPEAIPFTEARNLKPDGNISKHLEHDKGPLFWVLETLLSTKVREINLVLGSGYEPEPLLDMVLSCPISVTLWCQGYRYFRAAPPTLRLWVQPLGALSVWEDAQWQVQPIASEGFHALEISQASLIRYRPFPKNHSM